MSLYSLCYSPRQNISELRREVPRTLVHTRDKKSLYCNMAEECNSWIILDPGNTLLPSASSQMFVVTNCWLVHF